METTRFICESFHLRRISDSSYKEGAVALKIKIVNFLTIVYVVFVTMSIDIVKKITISSIKNPAL